MYQKYFTPLEAKKTLPLVRRIVGDILEKGRVFKSLINAAEKQEQVLQCYQLKDEIQVLIGELERLGCFFKDWNFEFGLVDFPAKLEGQDVFLCWKSDEEDLAWYHGIEEGFAGRKKIPEKSFQVEPNT